MSPAERIEFQLLLAKLTPARRQLVKTVLLATLNAAPPKRDPLEAMRALIKEANRTSTGSRVDWFECSTGFIEVQFRMTFEDALKWLQANAENLGGGRWRVWREGAR
jgi:hypothetical protein